MADGLLYTGTPIAERRELAGAALQRVGSGPSARSLANKLSGGERQRVAVARAIVGRPAMVLADEPTGNLDSKSSDGIVELIEELNAEGITMLVITHNQEIAERFPRQVGASRRDDRIRSRIGGGCDMPHRADPSKLHAGDILRTSAVGLRTRKMRAALSALGIMIGIASMVAVLGLSESSKSDLLAQLDRLGTNLLTVQAGDRDRSRQRRIAG